MTIMPIMLSNAVIYAKSNWHIKFDVSRQNGNKSVNSFQKISANSFVMVIFAKNVLVMLWTEDSD